MNVLRLRQMLKALEPLDAGAGPAFGLRFLLLFWQVFETLELFDACAGIASGFRLSRLERKLQPPRLTRLNGAP
jgi:hypothetical protein